MIRNNGLYSDKAANINDHIDNITKNCIDKIVENISLKISLFLSKDKYESIDKLLKDYAEENSRDYIQKYAETEINNFSSKMGKFAMVLALIALVISAITLAIEPQSQWKPVFTGINFIFLILLFVWLFKIIFETNLLKIIIMKIEDDKLNKQNEKAKSIIPETEVSEKDLKIKVEKFDLNLSISAGK